MTHDDWRPAAKKLRQELGPPTPAQEALAAYLGMQLSPGEPARVAAAALRDRLGVVIGIPPRASSHEQGEYLRDLEGYYLEGEDTAPSTRATASAWIDVLEARRALEALEAFRPVISRVVAAAAQRSIASIRSSVMTMNPRRLDARGGTRNWRLTSVYRHCGAPPRSAGCAGGGSHRSGSPTERSWRAMSIVCVA